MTDSADLERRYRRLLAVYPRAFRAEREQEVLAVLMAAAEPGQRWPRAGETADILWRALLLRMRSQWRRSFALETRHSRVFVPVRLGVGLWLIILGAIFIHYGLYGWAALVLPFAALHFWLAKLVRDAAQASKS